MQYNGFIGCEGSLAYQLNFLSNATDKSYRRYMEYIYIAPSETGEEGALCGVATRMVFLWEL